MFHIPFPMPTTNILFLYYPVCYGKRFGPKGYGYGQGGGALQSDQTDVANGYVVFNVFFNCFSIRPFPCFV